VSGGQTNVTDTRDTLPFGVKGSHRTANAEHPKVNTRKVNVERKCPSDVPGFGIHTNTYYRITIRYVKCPRLTTSGVVGKVTLALAYKVRRQGCQNTYYYLTRHNNT